MATKTWIGTDAGNAGDINTAANWSPSGVPVSTDDVVLPAITQSMSAGLDQSAVTWASFREDPGYSGSIGHSGEYLQVKVSGRATFQGEGTGYVDFQSAGGGGHVVVNRPRTSRLYLQGDMDAYLSAGCVDWNSGTIALLMIEQMLRESDVELALISPTVTAAHQQSGTVNLKGAAILTAWYLNRGALTAIGGISPTITDVEMRGGLFVHRTDVTQTDLRIYGGEADLTQDTRAKIITNCEVHSGGTLNARTTAQNITFTNGIAVYGSAVVKTDVYDTITY